MLKGSKMEKPNNALSENKMGINKIYEFFLDVLSDKYKKKMNKAIMYMYSAVDACQKDNEKYNEALKKSLNLVVHNTKLKKIQDVMDNNKNVFSLHPDLSAFEPATEAEKVQLKLQGRGYKVIEAKVVAAEDIHCHNTFEEPDLVCEKDLAVDGLKFTVPAASVVCVRLSK